LHSELRYFTGLIPSRPPTSQPPKIQAPASLANTPAEPGKIVSGMEAGQMPLEQTLTAYKRGT